MHPCTGIAWSLEASSELRTGVQLLAVKKRSGSGACMHAVEALNLILGFAFRDLNLKRVGLEVFDFNKRAHKCYLKAGFKEMGKKRKARFIDGKYHDSIVMDIPCMHA